MGVQLKTLADFRRFLATPGATVQITRHDYCGDGKRFSAAPAFFKPRGVKKLQTNGVAFHTEASRSGTWLFWDRGAGKRFRFAGNDEVTVDLEDTCSFEKVMTYHCWIEGQG